MQHPAEQLHMKMYVKHIHPCHASCLEGLAVEPHQRVCFQHTEHIRWWYTYLWRGSIGHGLCGSVSTQVPLLFKGCRVFGVPGKLESCLLVCVSVLVKHLAYTQQSLCASLQEDGTSLPNAAHNCFLHCLVIPRVLFGV